MASSGSLSNVAENLILEHSVGKAKWDFLNVYVRLYTDVLSDSDEIALSEVSSGPQTGYYPFQTSASDWSNAIGGQISNASLLIFGPASSAWGTIKSVAITDANKKIIWWGTLNEPRIISQQGTVRFSPGALLLTLS